MSCLGPGYDPQPPRAWSRVQNRCSLETNYSDQIYIPVLKKTVPSVQVPYELDVLAKGNILQYKKNSSNLTKQQRYSQIAKGMWTNRSKTWATQSQTYTNPNTTSLQRVNYITIPNTDQNLNPITYCSNADIKDGGSLICTQTVNPCTDEVIAITTVQSCAPTSASDVPGPIIQLCYNNGLPTYYPKQRYIMTNSTDKWPINYKLFVSANAIPQER
jgi:hypothetical protein